MNGLKQFFVCEDDIKELQYVSPWIIVIIADIILWAIARKLPVRLTSLLRDHNDGISESEFGTLRKKSCLLCDTRTAQGMDGGQESVEANG